MAELELVQGYFSYARHDAETDPKLVEALTMRLEKRVNSKLTNARFAIWRDADNLRTGEKWDDRINDAVRASRVFIAMLSPKWFESTYCRREYQIFLEVERQIGVGEYVVPLLARRIETQIRNFDQAQRDTYLHLNKRQYRETIATNFLALKSDERERLVDKIADDIEGMIERVRQIDRIRSSSSHSARTHQALVSRQARPMREFPTNPHNFNEVDFISAAEVLIEPPKGAAQRGVFVHLGFVERLYVKTAGATVEFSIRRAYLSIDDGVGKLARNADWEYFSTGGSVYYVNYKAAPQAVTICMNPEPGRTGLSDLPLPPAESENLLSMPATAAPDTDVSSVRASLSASLGPEGLFIAGEDSRRPSVELAKKIAAIVSVMAGKSDAVGKSGLVNRVIPVRER